MREFRDNILRRAFNAIKLRGGKVDAAIIRYLLNLYPNAAAAYSLNKLDNSYTGAAVEVRRDSDNTVLNIGFVNGILDTAALTTFCTTPVNKYTSDFSSTENLAETNATGSAANIIGGVSDAYQLETVAGGNGIHQARTFLAINQTFNISFDYYIPSTNSAVNEILVEFISGDKAKVGGVDSWQTANLTLQNGSNSTSILFRASQNDNVILNVTGDVFYLKNIVVNQVTSNGYVTKWYDQSGNGFDAVQNVASDQPKIFDGVNGVVLENGKPAIQFDGVNDSLDVLSSTSIFKFLHDGTNSSIFTLCNLTSNDSNFAILNTNRRSSSNIGYALQLDDRSSINRSMVLTSLISAGSAIQVSYNQSPNNFLTDSQQSLLIDLIDASNATAEDRSELYRDGGNAIKNNSLTNTASTNDASFDLEIFKNLGGKLQELIIYPNNQSSNRLPIENNINDRYQLYWSGATQRLLDTYTGAAAAYSLEAINANYTGNIIQVRRDSDNTVLNIGANYDGSLDVYKLENFCNTPVNIYTSDFANGEEFTEFSGTGYFNQSIGGRTGVYKFENDANTATHQFIVGFLQLNTSVTVSFDYYVPSTNTDVNSIKILNGVNLDTLYGTDQWISYSITFDVPDIRFRFRTAINGTDFNILAPNDVIYIDNLTFTQNTSNGYVPIWYDQSGLGNDVTQNTASSQPKIFDGINGVILENGKPSLSFDGVDDGLSVDIVPDKNQPFTAFFVRRYLNITGTFVGLSVDSTPNTGYLEIANSVLFRSYYGSYLAGFTSNTNQGLWYSLANSTSSEIGLDSQTAIVGNAGTNGLEAINIGSAQTAFFANMNVQEVIIYNSNQSSNRAAIEDNINNRYNIY